MKLIGIIGRKQSGKTILTGYMLRKYNGMTVALGDAVKSVCKILFDWSYEQLYGNLKEEIDPRWGISPRQSFEWVGTNAIQFNLPEAFPGYAEKIGRLHWCKVAQEKILRIMSAFGPCKGDFIVISDIRFKHEQNSMLEFSKEHNVEFVTIKITRKITKKLNSSDTALSETESDTLSADILLRNDGSLEDLYTAFDLLNLL